MLVLLLTLFLAILISPVSAKPFYDFTEIWPPGEPLTVENIFPSLRKQLGSESKEKTVAIMEVTKIEQRGNEAEIGYIEDEWVTVGHLFNKQEKTLHCRYTSGSRWGCP